MPERLPSLDDEAELALFRTLQEALANVARHAHARSVRISLVEQPGSLALVVEDDGRGFDLGDSGNGGRMGLVGMQERLGVLGGRLLLESAPGRGVRLVARVPLAEAQSA
jgi:signal transduction histidine kinase